MWWLAQAADPLGSLAKATNVGALAVLVVVLGFVGKSIRDASKRQESELERRDAENAALREENEKLRTRRSKEWSELRDENDRLRTELTTIALMRLADLPQHDHPDGGPDAPTS